ncbi:hypothetical protein ACFLWU_02800 [Chloroflexota bacterium]
MLNTDEYLKIAASNFNTAEAHLKDAEDSLRTLLDRLEACLERMRKLSGDGLSSLVQPEIFIYDSQLLDSKALQLVSR